MARAKYSSETHSDDAEAWAPNEELKATSPVDNVYIYCNPLWPYPQQPHVNTFDNRETCRPIWSGAEKQKYCTFYCSCYVCCNVCLYNEGTNVIPPTAYGVQRIFAFCPKSQFDKLWRMCDKVELQCHQSLYV